eukprot:12983737-Ditylum_brightwellii.AAC.1
MTDINGAVVIEVFFELVIFGLAGEDHGGEFFVRFGLEVIFGQSWLFEGRGDGAHWCTFCCWVYRLFAWAAVADSFHKVYVQ